MRVTMIVAVLATAFAGAQFAQAATADSAFTDGDGIQVPITANQSPGQERRATAAQDNAFLTEAGAVRMSHLLGASVVTNSGETLGTVREIMLNGAGEPEVIVDSSGRLVEVPWSKFVFDAAGKDTHGKLVLPGETRHALDELPEFDPAAASGSG